MRQREMKIATGFLTLLLCASFVHGERQIDSSKCKLFQYLDHNYQQWPSHSSYSPHARILGSYCTSLTGLLVQHCSNLISLADHNVSSLQSLSHLKRMEIGAFCQELDSFPDFEVPSKLEELILYGWPKLKSLPQQFQHSASLTCLSIIGFDGVEALPEWLGNLTSLTKLQIWECKNLMYLPPVEAMEGLTKLHELEIESCPRLAERCAKDDDPEWLKISHIPDFRVNWTLVRERFRRLLPG